MIENENYKRIIEINGIKVEVDLRTAKRVENFKVGDAVKLLIKKYSDDYRAYPGVICGIDEFNKSPTIIAAYLDSEYSQTELKFAYINSKSTEIEIAPMQDFEASFDYNKVINSFDKSIEDKHKEIQVLQKKKDWFIENWVKFFGNFIKDFDVEITK